MNIAIYDYVPVVDICNIINEYTREYSFLQEYNKILINFNPDKYEGLNNAMKIFSFYYWSFILNNEYRVTWFDHTDQYRIIRYKHVEKDGTFVKYLKYLLVTKKGRWIISYD